MRKGRLELWLGLGCTLLLGALAFGGYYRKDLQALWYRWRFERSDDPRECAALVLEMAVLGPKGHRHLREIVVPDLAKLKVLRRDADGLVVRNDRPHRVIIKAISPRSVSFDNLWDAKDWDIWAAEDGVFIYTGAIDMGKVLFLRGTDSTKDCSPWEGTLLEPGEEAELLTYDAASEAEQERKALPRPPQPVPVFGVSAIGEVPAQESGGSKRAPE